jgi:uncharacterized protein with PQ loop repeat
MPHRDAELCARRTRTPRMGIVSELVAWAATALAAMSALPQLRRLHTTRDLAGVSLCGPAIGAVSEAGWLVYVAEVGLWSAAPEPVLMVASNVALAATICRSGGRLPHAVAAGAVWASALALVTVAGGWAALGTMLGMAYGVQMAPYVWSAFRVREPTGIAARTWIMNLVEAALWGAYGLAHGDAPIVLYAVIGTSASGAILARVALGRASAASRTLSRAWALPIGASAPSTGASPMEA